MKLTIREGIGGYFIYRSAVSFYDIPASYEIKRPDTVCFTGDSQMLIWCNIIDYLDKKTLK